MQYTIFLPEEEMKRMINSRWWHLCSAYAWVGPIATVNIRGSNCHNIIMSFYDSLNNIASTGAFLHLRLDKLWFIIIWYDFEAEWYVIILLLETYSTDGQTPGCLECPGDSFSKETGATSVDQCSGIFILIYIYLWVHLIWDMRKAILCDSQIKEVYYNCNHY